MAPVLRPPPVVMRGELFGYAAPSGRVAFESPSLSCPNNNKCILLGGLSDGLMPVPYTSLLERALCHSTNGSSNGNWSLVQPLLSSSYTGFGHSAGGLDGDCRELDELLAHLVERRHAQNFAMVGHSTGTQIIVHYLKHSGRPDLVAKIRAVALQAPVSDREAASICDGCHDSHEAHMSDLAAHLERARNMLRDNQGEEMMPRRAFWAPISAQRYLDLFAIEGKDDYFSSDLTDDELSQRLGHIGALGEDAGGGTLHSCLVACSGSDEYVPETVDMERLLHRLCAAIDGSGGGARSGNNSGGTRRNNNNNGNNVAVPLYLPAGNHNLSSSDGADAQTFVDQFRELLARCTATAK